MNKLAWLLVWTRLDLVMFYGIRHVLNRAGFVGVPHPPMAEGHEHPLMAYCPLLNIPNHF